MSKEVSRPSRGFDRAEKKSRIADAAIRVFAEKGINGARMIEVAQEAGIGKGTIYEYFRTKEELFEFAVNRFFDVLSAQLQREIATTNDPSQKLEILIRTTFDSLRTSGPEMHIIFEIWAEGVRAGAEYFDLAAMYAGYREMIAGIVIDGIQVGQFRKVDPVSVAATIIGALDGLLLQWILMEDVLDLDKTPDEFIGLITHGLSAREKS